MSKLSPLFRAIILGSPGSGKGTISSRIVSDFGLSYVSVGDMLREEIASKSSVGQEAKKFIDGGQLVPDRVVNTMVMNKLASEPFRTRHWLLDGYPRTLTQAQYITSQGHSLSCAINLNVPDDEIIERIRDRYIHLPSGRVYHLKFNPPKKAGVDDVTGEKLIKREDDKEEVVKKRLLEYRERTEPVIDYYRRLNILAEFSGRESNEIWPRVRTYLAPRIIL